ncbi:MAG: TrkH family potassium uptake protein [Pseudomonadota bacterium]
MYDVRPVVFVIGRLTVVMGASMGLAMLIDLAEGHPNWRGMGLAGFLTLVAGLGLSVLTRGAATAGLSRQQAFLLTTLVWVALPIFGALPFVFGAPQATYTDAFFEAMSGLTTTGATVMSGLAEAPSGMLFWRALLQWYGGVGIVVFAMVFLPALKVGGMQFFRSESFDIGADILPRAAEVAGSLFWIYLALTIGCVMAYSAAGMTLFDAVCHAMTTVSTGGLGNYDDSFGSFPAAAQYVSVVFMWLAALPFIRFIQLSRGHAAPLFQDIQVRAFLAIILILTGVVATWLVLEDRMDVEESFRGALFNISSIMTGTGYATDDYSAWGGFPMAIFFLVALVGGCAGSTSCSAKVFRYQILFAALTLQIRRIHTPSGVFKLRYDHRIVDPEVLSSVMAYFFVFVTALSVWAILLSMLGLDALTSISGAVASLANVGPGLGPEIGPAGNYADMPEAAKWLLAAGMLLGRLEFISVLVLLTPRFWQR